MVEEQIKRRGITDEKVLKAMSKVERHLFVSDEMKGEAYEDHPLPIGSEQTISQPYIVAYMTEAVRLMPEDRVLEIGTGSGYQSAVLVETVKEVFSVEIIKGLADRAREGLKEMGYTNIEIKHGDGYSGWPENAPFDAIVVTAAPREIPEQLKEQLKVGGRMIIPVGDLFQQLYLITRTEHGFEEKTLLPVRFVPMVEEKGTG
ncbi:MAG: protein-L-isoaspartate(D-aspartate) O-methyltransferase [Candidatus Omnitrophica bacterium]|nr:protein-L-isoaspartate(D-aspartate) O-methyltransferase [Candidatus Omnitrophota bacterium]MBU1128696.1 protein-L-isoaspartate(D-aspartate) O-methyltransferase [Candidatus Omnitrophota bacterium]MBU1850973.1 protein-L-isoaspartate(D-aspartate) O-methyltransferase [Candidatus Omnitrophota bacterium]